MATVLVVDDDLGTRGSFASLLRDRGYDVLTAESGGRALQAIGQRKPDVVLLDLKLQDMTALDVLRELKSRAMETPCIVMTGFGTIESAVNAMKLGAIDYLTKPIEEEVLEAVLERALEHRGSQLPELVRADGLTRRAMAVASVLDAPTDPKNLIHWSRIRGVAPSTLRGWCRTAAMPPKASLDLARILRAVLHARSKRCPPTQLLEAADHRTLERLVIAGGLFRTSDEFPSLNHVLMHQCLITDSTAIDELRHVLREFGIDLGE